MSELVVVTFGDQHRAEEVRLELLKMDREHLVDIEDAVIVVRNKKGKVKLHHASHITIGGAVGGGFLGSLLGVIFLNPVFVALGLIAGASMGAVSGSMEHLGLDEDFMKDLANHLQPGTSALCVLVQQQVEKVIEDIQKYEGKIFKTTLKPEDEEKLKKAVETVQTKAQPQVVPVEQGKKSMEEVKRILVVSRSTHNCHRAVHYGVSLARKHGAALYVVYLSYDPFSLEGWNLPIPSLEEEYARMREHAKEMIDKMLHKEKTEGLTVKDWVQEGKPIDEMIKIIEQESIDLVITLAHPEGRIEYLLFGRSNAELLRKMPCSILFLRYA